MHLRHQSSQNSKVVETQRDSRKQEKTDTGYWIFRISRATALIATWLALRESGLQSPH
jgi:hypothetical protein